MAKTAKYWIYIISDYQWKDGSVGKIGVTDNPARRAKEYKLESLTILEEHTNAKEVSKREIELQKEYGFKVDNNEYWKVKKMIKHRKTDYKAFQKKRITNTDWEARRKNTDYKARTAKFDYKAQSAKRVANTDYTIASAKRTANTDYTARNNNPNFIATRGKGSEKRKKPINQYDLNGNFIKQWNSATDITSQLGIDNANISKCCRGIYKQANKFIWKYGN